MPLLNFNLLVDVPIPSTVSFNSSLKKLTAAMKVGSKLQNVVEKPRKKFKAVIMSLKIVMNTRKQNVTKQNILIESWFNLQLGVQGSCSQFIESHLAGKVPESICDCQKD
jgi:hypothetical protein